MFLKFLSHSRFQFIRLESPYVMCDERIVKYYCVHAESGMWEECTD